MNMYPSVLPCLARQSDGTTFETIVGNQGNRYWGIGVRTIPREVYDAILSEAGFTTGAATEDVPQPPPNETVLKPNAQGEVFVRVLPRTGAGGGPGRRWSRRSKVIGDHAEGLVFRMLAAQGKNPTWLANEALTPGWDIEYLEGEARIAVEVKGATGDRFTSISLTENEWRAAQEEGNRYHLYLVARCMSSSPSFEVIVDPASLVAAGHILATPSEWSLTRSD
jgi:hypothetical protein